MIPIYATKDRKFLVDLYNKLTYEIANRTFKLQGDTIYMQEVKGQMVWTYPMFLILKDKIREPYHPAVRVDSIEDKRVHAYDTVRVASLFLSDPYTDKDIQCYQKLSEILYEGLKP